MHSLPPSVKNAQHPDDIIGPVFYHDFLAHYRATYQCDNADKFNMAVKGFEPATRNMISDIYNLLDENGWYPNGFDKDSKRIKWRYRVSTPLGESCESMTVDEARAEYDKLISKIGKKVEGA